MASFESDVVAMALKDFIEKNKTWEGTTAELKSELEDRGQYDDLTNDRSWPKTPNYLSNRIRRIAPLLRSVGIKVSNHTIQGRKLWRFCLKKAQGADG